MLSLSWMGSLGHFLPEPVDTNLPAPFSPAVSGNPPSGMGNAASGVTGSQGATRVLFLERNSFRYPGINYTPSFGKLTAANNNNVYQPREFQIGAQITF